MSRARQRLVQRFLRVPSLPRLPGREAAQRYVDLGKLAVSRRTAEDTRTDALLITLELLRACQGVLDRPGPMVDRAGSPVLDEDGYASI